MSINFKDNFPTTFELLRVLEGLSEVSNKLVDRLLKEELVLTNDLEKEMQGFYTRIINACEHSEINLKSNIFVNTSDSINNFKQSRIKGDNIVKTYKVENRNLLRSRSRLLNIKYIISLFNEILFSKNYRKMKNDHFVIKVHENRNGHEVWISESIPTSYTKYIKSVKTFNRAYKERYYSHFLTQSEQLKRYHKSTTDHFTYYDASNDSSISHKNKVSKIDDIKYVSERDSLVYLRNSNKCCDKVIDGKILDYNLYNNNYLYERVSITDIYNWYDWISLSDAFYHSIVFPHIIYSTIIKNVIYNEKFDCRKGISVVDIDSLYRLSGYVNYFIYKFIEIILIYNFDIEYFELCSLMINDEELKKIADYIEFLTHNSGYELSDSEISDIDNYNTLLEDIYDGKKSLLSIEGSKEAVSIILSKIKKYEKDYIDNVVKSFFDK